MAKAGAEHLAAALEAARFDRDRFPAFIALTDRILFAQVCNVE